MNSRYTKLYYIVFALVSVYTFFAMGEFSGYGASCIGGPIILSAPVFIFSILFQLLSFRKINKPHTQIGITEFFSIFFVCIWGCFTILLSWGNLFNGLILGPFFILSLVTTGLVAWIK